MFEREIMISSLRKNTGDLTKLIAEVEDRSRFDGIDLSYWKETLKKIEASLRRIRKMDAQMAPVSDKYGPSYSNSAW